MKPKPFTAALLFISAYTPLFVILVVRDIDFENTLWFKHPYIVLLIVILVGLSNILLFTSLFLVDKGDDEVKVISTKDRSSDIINYTIPYIIPFVGVDLSTLGDIFSLIIFLSMMMFITIRIQRVFMNPILLICGYNLYDMEYSSNGENYNIIVLSKPLKTNDICYIISMSESLCFVTERRSQDDKK